MTDIDALIAEAEKYAVVPARVVRPIIAALTAERALSDRLANALWWYHTGMGCKTDLEALDAIDAARAALTAHTEARRKE